MVLWMWTEVWETPVWNCKARNPAALPRELPLGGMSSRWPELLLSLPHCGLRLGTLASISSSFFRSVRQRAS